MINLCNGINKVSIYAKVSGYAKLRVCGYLSPSVRIHDLMPVGMPVG